MHRPEQALPAGSTNVTASSRTLTEQASCAAVRLFQGPSQLVHPGSGESSPECDLGGSQLLIGTQAAPAPAYGSSLRPQLLQGGDLDDRPLPRWPLRLELQNVGVDPSFCRRIGNETYCY